MAPNGHRRFRFFCCSPSAEGEHDSTQAGSQRLLTEGGHDSTQAGAQRLLTEGGHDSTQAGSQRLLTEGGHDSTQAGSSQRDDSAASSSDQTQAALRNRIRNEDIDQAKGSAASSSDQTQAALRNRIRNEDIDQAKGKFVVDTHKLIQHIEQLFQQREEEKRPHQEASIPSRFDWPSVPWLKKLKDILSLETEIRKLGALLKSGTDLVVALKDIISEPITTALKDIGYASVATTGLLLVAYTLEGFHNLSTNKDECWRILKEMMFVATVVEKSKSSLQAIEGVIEDATTLVAEGAIMCCSQMDSSPWRVFFISSEIKQDLNGITKRLNGMYLNINMEIGIRVLSDIESMARSPLSREYPTHAVLSDQTQAALRNTIRNGDICQVEGKFEVDTNKLIQHIKKLFQLREKELKLRHQQASNPSCFDWPSVPGLKKLKEILSLGTEIRKLEELLKSGIDLVAALKDIISEPITTALKDIGYASVATAGLLLVAYTLEGFHNLSTNKDECWRILKEMMLVATVVERLKSIPLKSSPQVIEGVIEDATTLIAEGAIMCCSRMDSSPWKSFFISSKIKQDLSGITQRLNRMYSKIDIEIGIHVLSAIESMRRSPLSREYPTDAVGIDDAIEDVLGLLEIESDQRAVTVIIHGFGGMGKTTLADAVVSKVAGCKYSKVRLFENIDSKPAIIELQKQILVDLMQPGETIPNFRFHEDGQELLKRVLQRVQALIYIDNVLQGDELRKLLPFNMSAAKRVRILLTARDQNVKNACPFPCTNTKIYRMKGIEDKNARIILRKEINEEISDDQLKGIIKTCGGIPRMLKFTAGFIGGADNKQEAYATLMEQKAKSTGSACKEMRYGFAYDSLPGDCKDPFMLDGSANDSLPDDCKDPFLDICTYFNGWKWDIVEDIAGKDTLRTLERKALVTRTPNGCVSVHDLILELACLMSKKESKNKEVRLKFSEARKLESFLENEDTEGIKGIWLTEDRDELCIQASALGRMHNSLRVLQLGNLIEVKGNVDKTFEELVFFKAKISQIPFDVSQLEKLRYLSYAPDTLMPLSLPSSLRFVEFHGLMFRATPNNTMGNDEIDPSLASTSS